jgi:hypothetical protein
LIPGDHDRRTSSRRRPHESVSARDGVLPQYVIVALFVETIVKLPPETTALLQLITRSSVS